MKTILRLLAVGAFTAFSASVLADEQPVIHRLIYHDNSIGTNISRNGRWATACASLSVGDALGTAHLYDVDTDTSYDLPGTASVTDVTDDGNIVVGTHNGRPAYFVRDMNAWWDVPVPAGWSTGRFNAVTPDGHYAVGTCSDESLYYETGIMWNLQTKKEVRLTNLPKKNMLNTNSGELRFVDISADGRYVLMTMDFAYLEPAELCSFVYDVETQTYQTIGFTPNDNGPWTPHYPGIYFIDSPTMSPSGEWVTGVAYMVFEEKDNVKQYNAVFRMNVLTGAFELIDDGEGEYYAFAISDDGTIYGSSPTTSPLREWAVHYGKNWVPINLVAEQKYGVDFTTISSYERTGTAAAVSGDGHRILTIVDPTSESAVIEFDRPIVSVCEGVNLLASYTASPAAGSVFPRLTDISLAFDQKVQVVGDLSAAQLIDSEGTVKRSSNNMEVSSDGMKVKITFRGTNLNAGERYEVVIPAGTFAMANDEAMKNGEIRIPYTGRANEAVAVTDVYPADQGSLVKIDNTESPVQIKFDTNISVAAGKSAVLYLVEEGGLTQICPLNLSAVDNVLYLYPSTVQYLYNGSEYRIVLPEGSVTDVMGYGPNAQLELVYWGRYVREISTDDARIFATDFNNMSQSLATFLLYEGDHNMPSTEMASIGFDADNTPWNFSVRESMESTDFFATSHSSYAPSAPTQKSDDWMMIPQIFLPDDWCQLDFDAQRYHTSANDRLKVVVWECNDVINTLTPSIMERIKAEATVVFDEVIPAGVSDEGVLNEWTHYTVNLPEYGGKNVYIAFVNDNEHESAVFLDNVSVTRNLRFFVSLNVPEAVVSRPTQMISGTFLANSDTETVTSLSLTLRDGAGAEIGYINQSGLNLKKGDRLPFQFFDPLPLTIGQEVPFSIEAVVNGVYHETIEGSVKDLVFSPTKRVVIEEMTGFDCGNCPLGIIAFERLQQIYGDQVLPVSIHTYPGDPLGSGLSAYTDYLNIVGAPSGQVNRSGEVVFPIWQNTATGAYQLTNDLTHDTWLDCVQREFATLTEADVDISVEIDEAAGTFDIPVTVTYALDAEDQHLNLFALVLEDCISAYQQNYYSSVNDPLFGEWSNGGIYAKAVVRPFVHNDVARQPIGATFAGTGGYLPQSLKAGEPCTVTLTAPLPTNLSRRTDGHSPLDYAKVIVMLINADNGRVVNAARCFMTDHNYVVGLDTPASETAAQGQLFDLQGRAVSGRNGAVSTGLYIQNGKKCMHK